jgi:hypothetical protein
MADVPFNVTLPAHGSTNWDTALNAAVNAVVGRVNAHETAWSVPLDVFTGSTDDAKLQAAMAYAAAQTYAPAIALARRAHTFSGGPYDLYPGLRLVGSLGTTEREFGSTGPQCVVNVGGTALWNVPSGGVQNVWMSGIQWRASAGTVNWLNPVTDLANGPIMNDCTFEKSAWVGFASVMQARHLRVHIERTYVNESTGTPFKLAGSDNYYWTEGKSYLSSTKQSASTFYVWFTHMSRSRMGAVYITPQVATGIRIDGSYGDLQIIGTLLDSTGRTATTACQGAAVLITGGRGMVFDRCWFFNNAVNPASTNRSPQDKGQVYIRGSASDLAFHLCSFPGFDAQTGYTPAGTPAIYAATGVTNVKITSPIAPAGGNKLLQHQSAGIITKYGADDWTLAVA